MRGKNKKFSYLSLGSTGSLFHYENIALEPGQHRLGINLNANDLYFWKTEIAISTKDSKFLFDLLRTVWIKKKILSWWNGLRNNIRYIHYLTRLEKHWNLIVYLLSRCFEETSENSSQFDTISQRYTIRKRGVFCDGIGDCEPSSHYSFGADEMHSINIMRHSKNGHFADECQPECFSRFELMIYILFNFKGKVSRKKTATQFIFYSLRDRKHQAKI